MVSSGIVVLWRAIHGFPPYLPELRHTHGQALPCADALSGLAHAIHERLVHLCRSYGANIVKLSVDLQRFRPSGTVLGLSYYKGCDPLGFFCAAPSELTLLNYPLIYKGSVPLGLYWNCHITKDVSCWDCLQGSLAANTDDPFLGNSFFGISSVGARSM